jgi:hypothetical protein
LAQGNFSCNTCHQHQPVWICQLMVELHRCLSWWGTDAQPQM